MLMINGLQALQNLKVPILSSVPSGGSSGKVIFVLNLIYFFNGLIWSVIGTSVDRVSAPTALSTSINETIISGAGVYTLASSTVDGFNKTLVTSGVTATVNTADPVHDGTAIDNNTITMAVNSSITIIWDNLQNVWIVKNKNGVTVS